MRGLRLRRVWGRWSREVEHDSHGCRLDVIAVYDLNRTVRLHQADDRQRYGIGIPDVVLSRILQVSHVIDNCY